MITGSISQVTLDRDAIPSSTPPSVELQHLNPEVMHSPALNRPYESKRHDSPASERKREQKFSVPSLEDEAVTLPSFSASEPASGRSFSPFFESKEESSSSDSDSRSSSPASLSSDGEDIASARILSAEKFWQNKYFKHAVTAIKNFDIESLELLLGPEYYFTWLNFSRDKHNIRTPRLSTIYDYSLDFINQYEEKLRYDAKFYNHYRPKFTATFLKAQAKEEEISRIYPGVADVTMHATIEVLAEMYPLYRQYRMALSLYKEKGIQHYSDAIKPIKTQLEFLSVKVPIHNNVLTPEKILDFDTQIDWHIELKLKALIDKVENDIELEINVMQKTKSRPPLSKQKYKERYLTPYIEQLREEFNVLRMQYEKSSKSVYGNYDLTKLKQQLIIEINRLLLEEPKQLPEKTQNQTLEDYDLSAELAYHKKVEVLTRRMVLRFMPKQCALDKDPKDTFYTQMVGSRKIMGRDAFERIKDNDGKNLLFHAIEQYKTCSDADKTKLEPVIELLQRHSCQMFSPHAFMDTMTKKIKLCNVFEYVNLQHPSTPSLPNWPLLACAYEYMFTISPFEEEARVRILKYCQMTHKDLTNTNWYAFYVWFISKVIKEKRRIVVTQMSSLLHEGQRCCGDIELVAKIATTAVKITSDRSLTGFFGGSTFRDICTLLVEHNDRTPDKTSLFSFPGSVAEVNAEAKARSEFEEKLKQESAVTIAAISVIRKQNEVMERNFNEVNELTRRQGDTIQMLLRRIDAITEREPLTSRDSMHSEVQPRTEPALPSFEPVSTMRVAHLLHTDRLAPAPAIGNSSHGNVAASADLQRRVL